MQAARRTPLAGPPASGGAPTAGDQPVSTARPRRVGILVGIALLVLTLDIVSKVTVVATLSDRPPVRLLGGFLTLLVSRNPGAAFSIGTSMTVVFSAIAVGVIVVILRTSRRIRSVPWAVTLGLLLGGATGNLTDRIFRYPGLFRGYVVDWIEVPHWPVFNLADSAIVCGGVLAVLLSIRGLRLDGELTPPDGPSTDAAPPPAPAAQAAPPLVPAVPDSAAPEPAGQALAARGSAAQDPAAPDATAQDPAPAGTPAGPEPGDASADSGGDR
jgi:signal peptidase II